MTCQKGPKQCACSHRPIESYADIKNTALELVLVARGGLRCHRPINVSTIPAVLERIRAAMKKKVKEMMDEPRANAGMRSTFSRAMNAGDVPQASPRGMSFYRRGRTEEQQHAHFLAFLCCSGLI